MSTSHHTRRLRRGGRVLAAAAAVLTWPSVAMADFCPPGTEPSPVGSYLPAAAVVALGALLSWAIIHKVASRTTRVVLVVLVLALTLVGALLALVLGSMMAPCL